VRLNDYFSGESLVCFMEILLLISTVNAVFFQILISDQLVNQLLLECSVNYHALCMGEVG
jgi:hypothetical protein